MTPTVSVVVPTYRRPALLRRCLRALLAQNIEPSSYEIIVVDDGADPVTRHVAEEYGAAGCECGTRPAVRYFAVDQRRGPSAARNRGWRAARAPLIAFTDDDCIPDCGWLRAGVAACTDDVAGASGRIVVPLQDIPTDYQRNAANLADARFATANCFYRRSVLEAVGGFDERFRTAWREDTDLYFSLVEQGCRLVLAPEAIVVHPVRAAAWGISMRQQRKSMFNALLYKKHPLCYRQHVQPTPPWHYYRIVGALGAALLLGAAGQRAAAAVSGLAWLTLTGRFCAQRLDGTSRHPWHVAEMIVSSAVIPPLALLWRVWGAVKFRVLLL